MAQLTQDQITALTTILSGTFNGDVNAFQTAALTVYASVQKGSAVTALSSVAMTVADWPTVQAYVASGNSRILTDVVADINTAVAGSSTTNLGPLLVALYAAVKAHFGI